MKLLLIGPTGSIGSAILCQCLANPSISSLIILTHRPLSEAPHLRDDPRIKVIVVDSFTVYDGEVLQELEDAIGCLWCLGSMKPNDSGDTRKNNTDCTVAAASAFASYLAALPSNPNQAPFRFVCLDYKCGKGDQKSKFKFVAGSQRRKGGFKKQILALRKRSRGAFEAYVARPGFLLQAESRYPKLLLAIMSGIRADELASCMVDCVIYGNPKSVLEHQELVDAGRMLLADMR